MDLVTETKLQSFEREINTHFGGYFSIPEFVREALDYCSF